jgi:hypothetical protein
LAVVVVVTTMMTAQTAARAVAPKIGLLEELAALEYRVKDQMEHTTTVHKITVVAAVAPADTEHIIMAVLA